MADTQNAREYLKRLRRETGKSMQEVADAFGITRQYYEMIESGERQKKMDLVLIVKIADFFGVPLEQVAEYEQLRTESTEEPDAKDSEPEGGAE